MPGSRGRPPHHLMVQFPTEIANDPLGQLLQNSKDAWITSMFQSSRIFLTFLIILGAPAAQSESRALVVELRSSEAANAPIEKSIQLYSASYALVIGNDAYEHWTPLTNAVKDAQKVAKELKAHGFDVSLRTNLKAIQLKEELEIFI
jgi:hypothetical protein